jgi:hypothetical protein
MTDGDRLVAVSYVCANCVNRKRRHPRLGSVVSAYRTLASFQLLVRFFASGEVLVSHSDGTRTRHHLEVGDLRYQRVGRQRARYRGEEAYAVACNLFADRPGLPPDRF